MNGIQEVGGSTPPGSTKTLIRRHSASFAVDLRRGAHFALSSDINAVSAMPVSNTSRK